VRFFFVEDDLLYYQPDVEKPRRLCVPDDPDLRNAILFECHDTAARGHPGESKTLMIAQQKFYWLNMVKSVARYVRTCELCQRVKASQRKPAGLLHLLEIPHKRWTHISMDFMPDLPRATASGADTILVILDRLTKRAHFLPTTKTTTAKDTAAIFVRERVRLHGFPLSIVSDRDSRFLSAFWKAVMASQGTQIRASTAFKPSTDGQNERSHNDYLKAFVSPRQNDWMSSCPWQNSPITPDRTPALACHRLSQIWALNPEPLTISSFCKPLKRRVTRSRLWSINNKFWSAAAQHSLRLNQE
jgi:hypothetical protein